MKDPILFPGLMPVECLQKMPPTIVTTGEFDFMRKDALAIIEKLRKAGRLLDVLDMPGASHAQEQKVNDASALLSEIETIRIWNKFVLGEEQKLRPAISKNLFTNKYKKQGFVDEDIRPEHEENYPETPYPPPWTTD